MSAQATAVLEKSRVEAIPVKAGAPGRKTNGRRADTGNGGPASPAGPPGSPGSPDEDAQQSAELAAVTLRRLRWGVGAEVLIAVAVLGVTAVLVNSPTARESYNPPASAVVAFNTGGPDGSGDVNVLVTPDKLGPNQFRFSITNASGHPFDPAQVEAAVSLPQRNLGPLAMTLSTQKTGTYVSGPVIVTITGQWQLQITVRTDAFDETTVSVPVAVH